MPIKTSIATLTATVVLISCAVLSYTPKINPKNDPNAARINQDLQECKELAKNSTQNNPAAQAATNNAVSGLAGTVNRTTTDYPVVGYASGYSTGTEKQYSVQEHFKLAYDICMEKRGHDVLR